MSTDKLESALDFARRGFHVFPCRPGSKLPAVSDFPHLATRDEKRIRTWWSNDPERNVAISTSRFGDGKALLVIDVDEHNPEQSGSETMLGLDVEGYEFPRTLEHSTPTNGRHLYYLVDEPVRQGAHLLGPGIDVRSAGGYCLAPGSILESGGYRQINGHACPEPAPAWLVARLALPRAKTANRDPLPGTDADRARERARALLKDAEPAIEGMGGDQLTFKTIARIKDLGVSQDEALDVLADWNERCAPPWSLDDLETKVANVYKYGREQPGSAAPEANFPPVEDGQGEPETPHPLEAMNREFAFVDGHIIHETTDPEGRFRLDHMRLEEFHALHANRQLCLKEKVKPISKWWMEWQKRRQYDGLVFRPGCDMGPRWFNLWRGFSVEPVTKAAHPALDLFLEHARENVCNGDRGHFRWLMGWFAHMIQRPAEKPLVALVLKGKKGCGKNVLVECVGHLLGPHFRVADDDRYLTGNFNSHLENCLCIVFDEAVWSGDKKAEGRLKGLITGSHHMIERKGFEPYTVANITRVALLSNEDWIVPATHDERRFAVFNVGDGRLQDEDFFVSMKEGMRAGGFAHLLRYLLDYDLSAVNVNKAPKTEGLAEQILASLAGPERWLYQCASQGRIGTEAWPEDESLTLMKNAAYEDYERKTRDHFREYRRIVSDAQFWQKLFEWLPTLSTYRPAAKGNTRERPRLVVFPRLKDARAAIARKAGSSAEWPEPDESGPPGDIGNIFD